MVELEDGGQLRFDLLIPNLDKKGKYYKADYTTLSHNETIFITAFYSKWGFLKNWPKKNFA